MKMEILILEGSSMRQSYAPRKTARALAVLLCVLLCGCTAGEPSVSAAPAATPTPAPSAPPTPTPQATPAAFDPAGYLLGFVVDTGSFEGKIAGHAFLRNAETAGYPAKLYATNAVEDAISDGCAGVMVCQGVPETELKKLKDAGCMVVAWEGEAAANGANDPANGDANAANDPANVRLYTDAADFSTEAARALGEELVRRGLRGGVLIVADETQSQAAGVFAEKFAAAYPQFPSRIQSAPLSQEERVTMISGIAGIYCLNTEAAASWAVARSAAVRALTDGAPDDEAAPSPSPDAEDEFISTADGDEPTPSPDGEPAPSPDGEPAPSPGDSEPTPTPGDEPAPSPDDEPTPSPDGDPTPTPDAPAPSATLTPTLSPQAAARSIVIIATDYTQDNLGLLERGTIFAIAARPHFDAAAQGMFLLDRLLRGIQVTNRLRLNVPLIKKANIAKYQSIVGEALEWTGGV